MRLVRIRRYRVSGMYFMVLGNLSRFMSNKTPLNVLEVDTESFNRHILFNVFKRVNNETS